jgi:hypothetical protein
MIRIQPMMTIDDVEFLADRERLDPFVNFGKGRDILLFQLLFQAPASGD